MKTRLKIALSAVVLLFSLGVLTQFLQWMNRPSDAWLYAGALGVLSLLVLVPTILKAIWGHGLFTRRNS